MPRHELSGRVVAITGGARGIGLATAQACAAAGMRVAWPPRTPRSWMPPEARSELVIATAPPPWTLIPPPLIGASLLVIAERPTVAAPKLMMARPPTPVVVMCENVEFLTVSVPLFWIPPPSPVVRPNSISSPSIVTLDPAATDSRVVVSPLSVGVPLAASNRQARAGERGFRPHWTLLWTSQPAVSAGSAPQLNPD
jgi:hypothetical protein